MAADNGLSLRLVHGWGYDAGFWQPLRDRLAGVALDVVDQGYFGEGCGPKITDPVICVGHSLGAMQLYADPPPGCRALIAINGFDCFAARDGFPGAPVRVLDRMRRRLVESPAGVVADFRQRLGDDRAFGTPDAEALLRGLDALRDLDARPSGADRALPVFALDGGADPLLPPEMQAACFAGASRFERPGGGHLLPLTDPDWCAAQIRAIAAGLGFSI